jgi:hypothetical protein
MTSRKSIAVPKKVYQAFCKNRQPKYIGTAISETVAACPVSLDLLDIPKEQYSVPAKEKIIFQLSLEAWLHLKKIEYHLIFEGKRYDIPLNDCISMAILHCLKKGIKPEQPIVYNSGSESTDNQEDYDSNSNTIVNQEDYDTVS